MTAWEAADRLNRQAPSQIDRKLGHISPPEGRVIPQSTKLYGPQNIVGFSICGERLLVYFYC